MIDREHVFGLRNEAGEDIAGVRQGRKGGASFHGGLPRLVGLVGGCAGRIGG